MSPRIPRLRLLTGLFAIALSLTLTLAACTPSSTSSTPSTSPFADRMAKEHQGDTPVATEIASQPPATPVVSETVTYATVAGQPVTGFLAKPANAQGPLPAIITIHEWWGLNDNIKSVTERLAGEGYTVLAVDLYDGQVVDQPAQARALLQSVSKTPEPAQDNLKQAYAYLTDTQKATRVGSIGWCFGGAWSLNTGLLLPEKLNAMVIYYGRLKTEADVLSPLQMPIAGFFGGQDQGIPVASVKDFEATLKQLNKSVEIHIYDEAGHAFANPSGKNYQAEAAQDAWQKTLAFFAKTLKS